MMPSAVGVKREANDDGTPHNGTGSRDSKSPTTSPKRPKFERTFVPVWLEKYEWLRYDNTRNVMYCTICLKYQRSNAFTEGCQNFRRDNLNKHTNTNDHRGCVEQEILRRDSTGSTVSPSLSSSSVASPTASVPGSGGTITPVPSVFVASQVPPPMLPYTWPFIVRPLQSPIGSCAQSPGSHTSIGEPNGDTSNTNFEREELPITPNYLANPPFPYLTQNKVRPAQSDSPVNLSVSHSAATDHHKYRTPSPMSMTAGNHPQHCGSGSMDDELVLKVRVANVAETDFIEIEMDRRKLTFEGLLSTMCKELEVKRELVYKVRKLPDTIIRKDKDVQRLKDFQDLELVLSSRALSESSKSYGPAVSPKHVDVVY